MTYANYTDLKTKKPLRWWYDGIIDWRLANPGRPEYECAKAFGVTASYLSVIVNSDMFKARWEQRRNEHSEQIGASIQRKMLTALDTTLDIIAEQLATKRTAIPFKDTTKFMDDTLVRLGYGAPKGGNAVHVNVGGGEGVTQVTVSHADLQAARGLLRGHEARLGAEPARSASAVETPASQPKLIEGTVIQGKAAAAALGSEKHGSGQVFGGLAEGRAAREVDDLDDLV